MASDTTAERVEFLVFRCDSIICAVPVADVVETMRPLPTEPLLEMPDFLCGVAIIRGEPVPVVNLASVLGISGDPPVSRFVTVRVGERRVALATGEVLGSKSIETATLEEAPPLARQAGAAVIDALSTLDARFLVVLRSARVISEELWHTLEAAMGTRG